ncbi:sensor histidine kinase [Sphingobacterium paludis]|uniref:histidine kinase n=1 Tax=Sphingobacterium paludis TaxID=1476465 RepID=A0A4R7D9E9_9SPHI|nr:HAMP domain-containing sensor histidine kinase [Sphingobacterium paludis]TDS17660.1 signal transduction histidine kinase [Sphingobacterium paludis]
MKSEDIIYTLIAAVVVSKIIIGFLIFYLLKRKRELHLERANLSTTNGELQNHITVIEEQQKELLSAENFKLKILSLASHDLRTPFQELLILFEHVEILGLSEREFKEVVADIKYKANVSKGMLDNVLIWTAGQLRKREYSVIRFSLLEQVRATTDLFGIQLRTKELVLDCRVEPSTTLFGNVEIFNFVLRNLLSNAIKYSHVGGVIEVGVTEEDNQIISFYVRDFGKGMDADQLANLRVGEAVYSQMGTKDEMGAGLGLSLCRDLLAKVGWYLSAESELGKGSCFTLVLNAESARNVTNLGRDRFQSKVS